MENLRQLRSFLADTGERSTGHDFFVHVCEAMNFDKSAPALLLWRDGHFTETQNVAKARRDLFQTLGSAASLYSKCERTLQTLLEYSPVAMMVSTPDGRVEMVNRRFQALFGYSLSDMPSLELWWAAAFPDPEMQRWMRSQWYLRAEEAMANHQPECQAMEAVMTCRNGSQRFVKIKSVCVEDRQITTLLDMTEQQDALRSVREALDREQEASRAKDQFLAALSHELRTPLTPVLLAAGHLQSTPNLPQDARDTADVIRRNVEMEARLIDDLLDLARISNGKLELHAETVNIHDVIEATLQVCWSDVLAQKLQVILELDAGHPFCHADPARLQQVFWNLLKNAVKFTPPGGRINIRTSNESEHERAIIIHFSDTGCGMSSEVLENLFTAFQQGGREVTREFGGLGLGLAITRAIVEQHGGAIQADSPGPGAGSTFTIHLPTCPPPAPSMPAMSRSSPALSRKIRVLLVEDHQSTGQILEGVLQRIGHEVVWVQSCRQAAELLASDTRFDLLLSDLGLPDGNGLDLMPLFHERTGKPGIALSGYGMDEDIARTREVGFAMHLIKPVNVQCLREAIGCLAS